jgi:hypothetical protein
MARIPGSKNKPNPFKDLSQWISLEQRELLISKALELVNGVKCAKKVGNKTVVYDKPPDNYTIIQLLNHIFGSPVNKTVLSGDKDSPVNINVNVTKYV